MTAAILDGKALAEEIRGEIAQQAADFIRQSDVTPCLAAVLAGENPASQVYVRSKQKACEKAGIDEPVAPPARPTSRPTSCWRWSTGSTATRRSTASSCSFRCPKEIDETRILEAVSPLKDVDAFHPENVGRIVQGRPRFLPCTPHGIQQLLVRNQVEDRRGQRRGAGPERHRGQADGGDAHAAWPRRRRHRDRLPQPHPRPARGHPRGRHPHRGHRPGEVRHRRHGQARRGR